MTKKDKQKLFEKNQLKLRRQVLFPKLKKKEKIEHAKKLNRERIKSEKVLEDGLYEVVGVIITPKGRRLVRLVNSDPFAAHKDLATLNKEDWHSE